jgi:DNA segregation ATPase FtsK/SpoIIIE-like protein
LIDVYRDNWKKVLEERFTELKKQIEDIRLIYWKDDRKKTIHCKTVEDDNPLSDEDITDESKIDIYTNLRQKIENLEKNVLNEKMINEKIFSQYVHLLIRTLDKMKMYLTDHDISTQQFSENIKKILVKREKQFQRLLGASVLGSYNYHMLEYEITLQKRIKLSQSKERNFTELKVNCLNLFDFYIRQCVNFHSTLNINGICGDFDEFIEYFFGEKIVINENERKMIELSFAHFNIPLVNPQIVCRKSKYRQNKSENFLPSQRIDEPIKEEKEIDVDFIDLIKSIRNDRWTVLLGSTGSGKTTFVRWLICQFARVLFIEEKNMTIDGFDMGPVRIPILIRIGEFAQWLENHSNSSLKRFCSIWTCIYYS